VTLSDDAPGGATATAFSTASVGRRPGHTFVLTPGRDHVRGGAGNDIVIAASGTLTPGDRIDGGGGSNTLVLQGPWQFDLRAPTTLANIQIITAQEGQPGYRGIAGQTQTIYLRDELDAKVDVSAAALNPKNPNAPTITITGAHNADVINLASGNDVVIVGDA